MRAGETMDNPAELGLADGNDQWALSVLQLIR